MRCVEASRQLQLYIDNQLPISQIRNLEAHIAYCATCQQELFFLEEVTLTLHNLQPVAEPADMTMRIMQRVAMTPQHGRREIEHSFLRPSFLELVVVVILASITTLGIIWEQPSLRAVLPFSNVLSQIFSHTLHLVVTAD